MSPLISRRQLHRFMTDDEFLDKLREAFAVEAGEHIQALTSGLLAAEKSTDPETRKPIFETIFREAHSLKGAAGAVDHSSIQTLCQALESVFSHWKQKPTVHISQESFDVVNGAVDLITRLLQAALPAAGAVPVHNISGTVRRIQSLLRPAPPDSAPSPGRLQEAPAPDVPQSSTSAAQPLPTLPAGLADRTPPPQQNEPDIAYTTETVRIPVSRLDALLRQVEEMVAAKLASHQHSESLRVLSDHMVTWQKRWSKVHRLVRPAPGEDHRAALDRCQEFIQWTAEHLRLMERQLTLSSAAAAQDERSISALVEQLLDDTKRLVMLPCATLLDFFPKVVRDLSRDLGKEAELVIRGREVEMDKRVLQELKDPLLHLVRNAMDHGIEDKQVRRDRGKRPGGRLEITVTPQDGNKVEIRVQDDGGGLDTARIKAAAVSAGYLTSEQATLSDDTMAHELVFKSGLSTSAIITEISGRGLGMAIVQEKVEKLGGRIAITSTMGSGTCFTITVPVTLATFKGILVEVAGHVFVVPTASVDRVNRHRRSDIQTVENRETVLVDEHRLPLVSMESVLELPPREHPFPSEFVVSVVLGDGDRRVAFTVDGILNEQEVLVKRLRKPISRVRNVAGATVLPSGAPAIILNTSDLLQSAARSPSPVRKRHAAMKSRRIGAPARKILVTDDSVTSRMLLKNILQSAGYDVSIAVDGVEAYTALKTHEFDLLVSDVQMPRMDGFDLTAKIRADKKLADLPVVLVTALGSREDHERGVDVGANAYVVKGNFDQSNLLDVIRKLL
ncbi:response regulator [Verrucomicrobium sp. BvORR034]|uniref:hybrid sensor histidine kinase/response regulator n=1 Tax=Verrucomicrobium sp. BvORR034 TaxID=1396418 RepID=UPI002240ECE0|nr:response regulator [Verrucomicrobium sp. BvORR034]